MKYILAKKRQWTQTHKMGNIHPRTRGTNRRFLLLNSPHSISERFDAGVAQSVERQTLTHEDIWWSWVRSPPSVINFFCSITTFKLHFYTPRRGRAPSMPASQGGRESDETSEKSNLARILHRSFRSYRFKMVF